MKRLLKLKQRGDTIIEVMVVLAVLGFAISISYATANRSLLATRAAQESSEATALLKSQIELLRYLAPNGTAVANENIFQAGPFCIQANVVSTTCKFGLDDRYNVAITRVADNTFTLKADWENVQGQGRDSATLVYRVHAP